ncbi:MAG: putative lipid II flippase FtsW [Dehalococcoidia bacterium]
MAAAEQTGRWQPGHPDYALLVLTGTLLIIGLVALYSASFVIALAEFGDTNYFINRQVLWAAIGLVLLTAAARTDYGRLQRLAVPIMTATIVALVAVLLVGLEVNGARRWIGAGPFTVQPAEFAKLATIIYLAAWLASKGESIRSMENGFVPFVIIISSVAVLIMLEPDMGTTLVLLGITVTMFWVAGASFVQMLALAATGLVAMGILSIAEGYRLDRLQAFLNAEHDPLGNGFQTLQALIAMGNGGIDGLGLGASRGKFFYIPASHTDGIFAIIGEELGIVGSLSVLGLFLLFMIRGYQVARRARDDFGMLIATGVTTWVAVQALLNIGGITRTFPLTGVPLPFMSSGGSALAALLLAIGIMISVSRYGADRGGYGDRDHDPADHRVITRRRV